jgi:NDP-sugar pyrophosphorylase family protein
MRRFAGDQIMNFSQPRRAERAPLPPVAVLAGGLATRLRPVTRTLPKSLVPVAGHPFVHHQLAALRKKGVTRVVLCVGYLGEQIRDYVGDGQAFGLQVAYAWDGDSLRGTGGALQQALPLLGEAFFVLYGDSYLPIAFADIWEAFAARPEPGLMTVYKNQGRWDTSNVLFSQGRILRYDKKEPTPDMQYIDYGLSLLRPAAFKQFPAGRAFDLSRVFQVLIAQQALAGWEAQERFYEIGSPQGLRETEEYLRNHL